MNDGDPVADTIGLFAAARAYSGLPEPTRLPVGDYRAVLPGPAWFRALAGLGLAIGGLPRWHGKRFRADGSGINLLRPAAPGGPPVERCPVSESLPRCRGPRRPACTGGDTRPAGWTVRSTPARLVCVGGHIGLDTGAYRGR